MGATLTTTAEPTAGASEPIGAGTIPVPIVARPYPVHEATKGSMLSAVLRTTDHKVIGRMYMVTSLIFFAVGGILALLMRTELAAPGLQFLSNEQFNQLFTMHGTIMLLFYATPIVFGFANLVLPLQIGAPDVAFPRLNAFSFWLFLFGATIGMAGFITPGGAADFGWTAYTPLTDAIHSPGAGADLWIMGLIVAGLGTILGGVNMITTVVCMRAPGMTMFRMPIFTWNILVTSILVLIAFPLLTAALFGLAADRHLGAHVYDSANGGVLLWQHLFWFFGHPEVYIVALPFFGIVSEIIPVFSRKPIFGYTTFVYATLSIAASAGAGQQQRGPGIDREVAGVARQFGHQKQRRAVPVAGDPDQRRQRRSRCAVDRGILMSRATSDNVSLINPSAIARRSAGKVRRTSARSRARSRWFSSSAESAGS